jgi:hypothetical protein
MIIMTLHPAEPAKPFSSGEFFTATATWSGRNFSARTQSGVTMALARELVAAGCPDQAWQAERAGAVALFGPSLHRLALLTVSEGGRDGPRFTKYQPHHLARAA